MTAAGVTIDAGDGKGWKEGQEGEHSRAYEHDSLPLERKHYATDTPSVVLQGNNRLGNTTAGITLFQFTGSNSRTVAAKYTRLGHESENAEHVQQLD